MIKRSVAVVAARKRGKLVGNTGGTWRDVTQPVSTGATDVNFAFVLLRPPTTGRREKNGERNGDGIDASNCYIKVLFSVATDQNNNDDIQQ